MCAYDASKPVNGSSLVAADVRENFRALKEDFVDPAADTAGWRTLGTGAVQAMPGNTALNGIAHTGDVTGTTELTIGAEKVKTTNLKTVANTTGSSGSITTEATVLITMQDYCFAPNIYGSNIQVRLVGHTTSTADTTARIGFFNIGGTTHTYAVRWRYITASDKPFLYAIRDKVTGKILHLWVCDDPPHRYWGLDEKPNDFIAPVSESSIDLITTEEIVLFNQDREFCLELGDKAIKDKKLPFQILNDYDYNKDKKIFSIKNIR